MELKVDSAFATLHFSLATPTVGTTADTSVDAADDGHPVATSTLHSTCTTALVVELRRAVLVASPALHSGRCTDITAVLA